MENDEGLVFEVERIQALLRQNQPQLHSMQETAAVSHPAPVFIAMRLKYIQISEVEKHLYPQYCVFWNNVDDPRQMYEYVETALIVARLIEYKKVLIRRNKNSGLFSDSQFSELRHLFENDKNFAFFFGLSANCPQLFAEEWRDLDLVAQIGICIQRMDAVKTEMDCQLESLASDSR